MDQTSEKIAKQAKKAYQSGNFQQAANLFRQALESYAKDDDELNAAEMANNLSVALLQNEDAKQAYEAALGTEKTFEAAGDIKRQAIALGNQAAALEKLGELKTALDLYIQSNELLKQTDEKELRSFVLKSISALQVRTGSQLQALASMDAALDNKKRLSIREKFLQKLLKVPFRMMKK